MISSAFLSAIYPDETFTLQGSQASAPQRSKEHLMEVAWLLWGCDVFVLPWTWTAETSQDSQVVRIVNPCECHQYSSATDERSSESSRVYNHRSCGASHKGRLFEFFTGFDHIAYRLSSLYCFYTNDTSLSLSTKALIGLEWSLSLSNCHRCFERKRR